MRYPALQPSWRRPQKMSAKSGKPGDKRSRKELPPKKCCPQIDHRENLWIKEASMTEFEPSMMEHSTGRAQSGNPIQHQCGVTIQLRYPCRLGHSQGET